MKANLSTTLPRRLLVLLLLLFFLRAVAERLKALLEVGHDSEFVLKELVLVVGLLGKDDLHVSDALKVGDETLPIEMCCLMLTLPP